MKVCFKCGEEQPLSAFYRHPMMADGHLGKCKECTKRDVATNYQANKKHYQGYERNRFQDSGRKAKVAEYQRRMRANNRPKYLARGRLAYAIRRGKVERPDHCESCGKPCKPQGHHHDYDKPLDVQWLCFACHRAEHGQEVI